MLLSTISQLRDAVGLSQEDARRLKAIGPLITPAFPKVVDVFYAVLLHNEVTRAVFTGGQPQLDRLRRTLYQWLVDLFSGEYGDSYFEERCNIGRVHVRVGVPNHYVFVAMALIRTTLIREIEELNVPGGRESIVALNKMLDIELAVMNETYREDLISRMQVMERRQFEQKLSESEHLATIGRLAATLAHEIKNPLAGISGAIQVIGSELGNDHPHRDVINEVMRQIDRLDAAVRDLLIFARPKPPAREMQDMTEILQRAMILFREEPTCRDIAIVCEGLDAKVMAAVDETQIQQVITNLLLNAVHACGAGGIVWCRLSQTDSTVRVEIEDNGTGVRPDVLERVFEPFFTTKARGTGLGLPICKRIVETHGGTMRLESTVGEGTRATVEIPKKS